MFRWKPQEFHLFFFILHESPLDYHISQEESDKNECTVSFHDFEEWKVIIHHIGITRGNSRYEKKEGKEGEILMDFPLILHIKVIIIE